LGFQPNPDKRSTLDRFFASAYALALQGFDQSFLKVGEIAVYRNGLRRALGG